MTMVEVRGKDNSHIRYLILFLLFVATTVNYADRSTISIAGPKISSELGLNSIDMGFIFSAFGWAYTIAQLPGGWLLDKFGSKKVYGCSIFFWGCFSLMQGFVHFLPFVVISLFALRFCVGICESPIMPANSRIVVAWFPLSERGVASAIFNLSQYAALVIFSPLLGFITEKVSWHYVFITMGSVAIVLSFFWFRIFNNPKDHPGVSEKEMALLEYGGAMLDVDKTAKTSNGGNSFSYVKQLLSSRMMLGIYLGNYCVNAITWFFLSWFPIYLVQGRGMSILHAGFVSALPAIFGCIGGFSGGYVSDLLLKKGHSLTVSRKVPIIVGMLLCSSMFICNYTDSDIIVVAIMCVAFFGKGFGALGWTLNADTAPKEIIGLSGGVLNFITQIGAIVTPIAIGYILHVTHSFNGALIYVACNCLMTIFSYLFIVGEIKRLKVH
ncbi:TPA: MFS transporter [Citrobacter freundii]